MPTKSKPKSEDADTSHGRPKNFTVEEDVCLARAYSRVATDPEVGNQQTINIFWARIKQSFDLFCEEAIEVQQQNLDRTWKALKNRWDRHISKDVQVFLKFKRANAQASGENDQVYNERISDVYRSEMGKPFRFLKCVDHLLDLPGFSMAFGTPKEQKNSDKDGGGGMASAVLTLDRPMGKKKAKTLAQVKDVVAKAKGDQTEALWTMGKKIEACAMAIEKKTLLDHHFKMLEYYQKTNQVEMVQEIIKKMEKLEKSKFPLEESDSKLSGKRKASEEDLEEEDDSTPHASPDAELDSDETQDE